MVLRSALAGAVALAAASAALAAPPFARVRTLATVHGTGSVSLTVGLQPLHSRAWLVRLGGTGLARAQVEISWVERAAGAGRAGGAEMFSFALAPNARRELWRYGGSADSLLQVTLRGRRRLVAAVRGS